MEVPERTPKPSPKSEESDGNSEICGNKESPSLAQRVKEQSRIRQPSRFLDSPYAQRLELTDFEKVAYKYALIHISSSPNRILAQICGLPLPGSELKHLGQKIGELSDTILDNYIFMIQQRRSSHDNIYLALYHVTSWMHFVGMSEEISEHRKTVIADTAENWRRHDMVIFPIHHDKHWFVGLLRFAKEEFQILDSLPHHAALHEASTRLLRTGIGRCFDILAEAKNVKRSFRVPNIRDWNVRVVGNIPRQTDSYACGVFCLKHMQYWDGDKLSREFEQADIMALRKQMTVELILAKENYSVDVQKEILDIAVKKKIRVGVHKA